MNDIALLGGTFDPIHLGHIELARAAVSAGADVIIMPAKVSPFKLGKEMAPGNERFTMAELASRDIDGVIVSRYELDSYGNDVSYTFDTLCYISDSYPGADIYLIVGSDQFFALEDWHKGKEILSRFGIMLAKRPGFEDRAHEEKIMHYKERYGTNVIILDNEMLTVSSTAVKERIKEKISLEGLVPQEVENYINEHGLYR